MQTRQFHQSSHLAVRFWVSFIWLHRLSALSIFFKIRKKVVYKVWHRPNLIRNRPCPNKTLQRWVYCCRRLRIHYTNQGRPGEILSVVALYIFNNDFVLCASWVFFLYYTIYTLFTPTSRVFLKSWQLLNRWRYFPQVYEKKCFPFSLHTWYLT